MNPKINPKKHLEYYSRVYPLAWKQTDELRTCRGKDLPFWPDWCYLPLSGAHAIVSHAAEQQGISLTSREGMALMNDVGVIGALAAWRVTQGIYRFDPDVYADVVETPITGDLPHDVLFNLPEWCVYVETPGLEFMGRMMLHGFFAYLEYDVNSNRKELRLTLDVAIPEKDSFLVSQVIHLGDWSLLESLERALQEAGKQAQNMFGSDDFYPEGMAAQVQDFYMPMISLLLYICSANGEIDSDGQQRPTRPRPKKTKKGLRMFPPQKVTTWDIGIRMGAALRLAKQAAQFEQVGDKQLAGTAHANSGERARPRPHVRRAHWHGYWTGPRDGEQKYILKWLSPVLVGGEDIPVTIRPVK